MYYPDMKDFKKLAKKGNLIPVYREILADLETPVSAFLKISKGASYAYLLESIEGQEKIGRYSFIGAFPSLVFKNRADKVSVSVDGKDTELKIGKDPLDNLKKILSKYKPVKVDGLPRFFGGMVGYVSYDMVRFFEDLPDKNPDKLNFPDAVFLLTDTLIIFDHIQHKIKVVSNAYVSGDTDKAYKKACAKIDVLARKLQEPLKKVSSVKCLRRSPYDSSESIGRVSSRNKNIYKSNYTKKRI